MDCLIAVGLRHRRRASRSSAQTKVALLSRGIIHQCIFSAMTFPESPTRTIFITAEGEIATFRKYLASFVHGASDRSSSSFMASKWYLESAICLGSGALPSSFSGAAGSLFIGDAIVVLLLCERWRAGRCAGRMIRANS